MKNIKIPRKRQVESKQSYSNSRKNPVKCVFHATLFLGTETPCQNKTPKWFKNHQINFSKAEVLNVCGRN